MNREHIIEQAFFASWVVSLLATAGSLFFSEVMKFIPCELCWYQRILMYPLVVMLGVATVRKEYKLSLYALIFSLIGGSISLYHYLIQKIPALSERGKACGIVPCDMEYINWFGFVTIPFLALVAFVMIAILQGIVWKNVKKER